MATSFCYSHGQDDCAFCALDKRDIPLYLKRSRRPEHGNYVDCAGCVKRGVTPRKVKPQYVCNSCADIEEGAF